jgi:small subunit ribosomal protein S1
MGEDPWIKDVEKIKKGQSVEGTITRITPFGAFVQLTPAVEALVHVSEIAEGGSEDAVDPEKIFKLNEKKQFKVLEVNKEARKIALSLKD